MFDINTELYSKRAGVFLRSRVLPTLWTHDTFGDLARRPRAVLVAGLEQQYIFTPTCDLLKKLVPNGAWNSLSQLNAPTCSGAEVFLSLPLSLCFDHCFTVPQAALAQARNVATLELSRVTPFSLGEVYTGCYVSDGADARSGKIWVRQLVVRRDVVESAARFLEQHNCKLAGVVVRDEAGSHLPVLVGTDDSLWGALTFRKMRSVYIGGLIASAISAIALNLAIMGQASNELSDLHSQAELLRPEVKAVFAEVERAKSQVASVLALQKKSQMFPSVLETVSELSRILPDDTALSVVSLNGQSLVFEGVSHQPEKLVASLEASKMFKNVSFASPVIKAQTEQKAHFSMKLDLEVVKAQP